MMRFTIKLFVIFLFFVPYELADADILIYNMSITGYDFNGISGNWEGIQKKDRGYLILDIRYDDPEDTINVVDAKEVVYWKDGGDYLFITDDQNYQITRILYRGNIWWFLTSSYADAVEVQASILNGQSGDVAIDFDKDVTVEVASQLTGRNLSDIQLGIGHYIDMWSIKLRLNSVWTKLANNANNGDGDFDYAVEEIVKAYLIRRGYEQTWQ